MSRKNKNNAIPRIKIKHFFIMLLKKESFVHILDIEYIQIKFYVHIYIFLSLHRFTQHYSADESFRRGFPMKQFFWSRGILEISIL